MSIKLAYLFLLGVSLIVGYVIGRAIAKRSPSRLVSVLLGLSGMILYLVGLVAADHDHRYRLVSIVGLCLQVAGVVSSFRSRRTFREHSVDLWAQQK
jgi:predicted MFS family arabinose efflux permease